MPEAVKLWNLVYALLTASPTLALLLWYGARIIKRLDRLNGTVAKHTASIALLKERTQQHERICASRHKRA